MVTAMLFNDQAAPQGLGTILILEDEVMVSTMMEDELLDLGAAQVLVCGSVEQARDLVERSAIHCAILDIQVGGADSFLVADALAERGIPFFFASASGPDVLCERHRHRPLLSKPFSNEQLRDCIAEAVATR